MTHKYYNNGLKVLLFLIGLVAAGLIGIAGARLLPAVASSGENQPQVSEATEHNHADEPNESDGHEHSAVEGLLPGTDACCPAEGGHVDEVQLTPEALEQNGIQVLPVERHTLAETLVVPGRVSFNLEAMAHIGTPVEGRVAEIRAKLGDEVQKGDVLFIIDSPALGEAQSDYLQKCSQVRVAESALEVAQTAAERARRLLDSKGISLGEYQKRDGDYKAARGELLTAQTALTAAENNLHLWSVSESQVKQLAQTGEINPRYEVRAPISGQVVEREATLGEIVGPERDALLVLANMETMWVLASVPEHAVHKVIAGSTAYITLDALPEETFQGRIAYIAPALDPTTRTSQVRVEMSNGHLPLKAGMFAKVTLTAGADSQNASAPLALAVPVGAVQIVEGGPAVFVEVDGEPNTYAKQAVEVGPPVNGLIPLLSGVEEGTKVVCSGAFILKAQLAKGEMEGKSCSGH